MNLCSTETLRKLEIINLKNGARLGYASDFEFDKNTACVTALIIGGSKGFLGLGKTEDLYIPWRCIRCFGEDTILVELGQGDCCCSPVPPPKKHGRRDEKFGYFSTNCE
ncbi:MAG: YlmC/YmxH family sporulation protein [Clostridia bacterium]|nr:YlmC/YmxH family sporulation protein [Clostridia bacterium]